VTKKIILAACRIAAGHKEPLHLGNISIARDWGWAPEYVNAMWLMLQQPHAEDYIIATGKTHSLEEFIDAAFSCLGLDWREHVDSDPALFRPSEIMVSLANPAKAFLELGWKANKGMVDVVKLMVEDILTSQSLRGSK
jgi:GDPmannose 4,6-dehydratase